MRRCMNRNLNLNLNLNLCHFPLHWCWFSRSSRSSSFLWLCLFCLFPFPAFSFPFRFLSILFYAPASQSLFSPKKGASASGTQTGGRRYTQLVRRRRRRRRRRYGDRIHKARSPSGIGGRWVDDRRMRRRLEARWGSQLKPPSHTHYQADRQTGGQADKRTKATDRGPHPHRHTAHASARWTCIAIIRLMIVPLSVNNDIDNKRF